MKILLKKSAMFLNTYMKSNDKYTQVSFSASAYNSHNDYYFPKGKLVEYYWPLIECLWRLVLRY